MPAPVIDPWLDDPDGFTRVDFTIRPEDALDPEDPGLDIHPGLDPEVVIAEGGVIVPPTPSAAPEPDPEETSEVIDLDDGGSITLEKDKGWWVATLDPGTGANPEKFKGKNKNQLVVEVLKGKLNATKKIRELNRQVKLGGTPVTPRSTPIVAPTGVRELTTDDIFEISTNLQANPDIALESWFQKKFGLSASQLVSLAQKGAAADANLATEAVSKEFLASTPEYYPDPQGKNLTAIGQWLAKFKLGEVFTSLDQLYQGGVWTVENLEEAYQDLSADGMLVKKAARPVVPVTPAPEPTPQPRTEERIVRTETRPRAALGLRPTDVAPTPVAEAPKAPSVEDLDNLTDDQISQLMAGARRFKTVSRRS